MRFTLSTALALGLFVLAPAKSHGADAAELARTYVELPAVQNMNDAMFDPEAMVANIRAFLPARAKVTEAQLAEMGRIASEELQAVRPKLEEAMIIRAAEMFTATELETMIEFYSSPEGAAILAKTQPFMAATLQDVSGPMQTAQQSITRRVQKLMQE